MTHSVWQNILKMMHDGWVLRSTFQRGRIVYQLTKGGEAPRFVFWSTVKALMDRNAIYMNPDSTWRLSENDSQ